jgi:hypothetical protein
MALAGKRKISLSEMSQEINLERRLGREPTEDELEVFAQMAIERINQRTLDGETVNGGSFAPYSEEYADKKGVSKDSVDLFLEGDMLDSLSYEISDSNVKIYVDGDLQVKKGYNHHVGDTLKKRPWFGITPNEVGEIISSLPESDDNQATTRRLTLADLEAAVRLIDFE